MVRRSKDALYLNDKVLKLLDKKDTDYGIDLDDLVNMFFPKETNKVQYRAALILLDKMIRIDNSLNSKELRDLCKKKKIPVHSMYDVVLPKLVRLGYLEKIGEEKRGSQFKLKLSDKIQWRIYRLGQIVTKLRGLK